MRKYLQNFIPKNKEIIGILLMLFMFTHVEAQVNITGKVTEEGDDFGLPGVSIIIKNSDPLVGAITDYDGTYELQASVGDTLEFSFVGYHTEDILVASGNPIDLVMRAESETLDEIVVIGYGAVKKEDLTGGVAKVSTKDFNKGIVTAPENLLNGKVAGLQISNNGEPGGGSRIRLRGASSINASSDPLYVVDGVPLDNLGNVSGRNPLNFINPSDIEDITVLKDASAAAIYGSRGASGVIMITTKSGKGKPKISYDGYYSVSQLAANPSVFGANTYRNVILDKAPQNERKLGDASTDWIDEVTQLAQSQKHNITLRGATLKDKLDYYVSLGYQDNQGIILTSANQNTSVAVNLGTELFDDNLEIDFQSKNGWTYDRFTPGVMNAARIYDPTQPVFDADSPYGGYYQWSDPLATNNPVSTLMLTDESGKAYRSLNGVKLAYHLPMVEGLTLTVNAARDRLDGEKNIIRDPGLWDGNNAILGGFLQLEDEDSGSDLIETYGTYKMDLPSVNSKLNLTLGHSWQESFRENFYSFENDISEADTDIGWDWNLTPKQDSFQVRSRLISFYGRLNYNVSEKYLFTLSLRRDGSSRFGLNNQWGLFPSAAFAWRILEEDFASGLNKTFDNLKLRLGYGVTGNERIGDYLYSTFYFYGTDDARYQFGDQYVNTLRGTGVDPNIKWEQTTAYNLGIDFGLSNGRYSGSIDMYRKYTDDLLFTVAAAAFTNLKDRILTNIGEMKNQGIELNLNAVVYDRNKFNWNLGFNAAHNSNEITKLDNNTDPDFLGYETGGISGDVGQTIQVLKVGESINSFRTYEHRRDSAGDPLADGEDWNEDGFADELDIYVDQNGDGIINENDLYIPYKADPDLILGLTSNMNYGNWDMGITLRSNLGGHVYNNVASSTGYYEFINDRVNNNPHPSSYTNDFAKRQLKSDVYVEKADFIKLDNVTIGYSFNNVPVLNNARLYVTGQNLLTLSGYSGLDPEIPLSGSGIDNNLYPLSRVFLFGLNATF